MTATVLAICDTETTGFSDTDQVLEIAVRWQCGPNLDARWSCLIRPEVPCTPGARAAHHVTDAMLASAAPLAEWTRTHPAPFTSMLGAGPSCFDIEDVVLVAHNEEFDRRMLVQSGVGPLPERRICTWRCAMHLFPNAESHKLQSLRYELGLEIDEPPGLAAHRAAHDVETCDALLRRMFGNGHSILELEELTKSPVLLATVRFGKYRGQRWADMDSGYLRWILSKDFDADVLHTARHYLEEAR